MSTAAYGSSPDRSPADAFLASLISRPYAAAFIPLACAAVVFAVALALYAATDLSEVGLLAIVAAGLLATIYLLQRALRVAKL
jgi:hypothetical protein